MVFIPGGGYTSGSTNLGYGPQHLLDHDVILVTLNYRLGPMGFLSIETQEAGGNQGLWDQLEGNYRAIKCCGYQQSVPRSHHFPNFHQRIIHG